MLIEFPLPFFATNAEENIAETENSLLLTQLFFPIIGLVCALLAILLAMLLDVFLYPIPAAAVFAGVVSYFCIYKDNGRGFKAFMAFIVAKTNGVPLEESLLNLPDSDSEINSSMATLLMVLTVLFKVFAFFLMALYGYTYWLVALCVLEFTIEGDLATLPLIGEQRSLLAVKKSKANYIWCIAGFLVLFVLFKAPVASLLLFAVAFVLSYLVKVYCKGRFNGINLKIIGLTAYLFELFGLLLGLILLTKGNLV
jgi:cobalamin synthase